METGLQRFVDLSKDEFVGREALLQHVEHGFKKQLITMIVDCDIASAHAGDSVYKGAELIGSVSSGGYGHRVKKNIAYAFINPELIDRGTELELNILGERYKAVVSSSCLYDASNERVRK
jgi:dimethylglycine dehydrogenase